MNTVNTQGVMGKGIALQFKSAFPTMFKDYAVAVNRGEIKLGRMHVWPTQTLDGPTYVINFPTTRALASTLQNRRYRQRSPGSHPRHPRPGYQLDCCASARLWQRLA